ncbi:MAG: hypothetical protein C5B43_02535 [Verrucomicrobia bacterium]|nr:MAG: hypothetical protein C5B43_02535 [Verrucomicrobiota bacterium]
MNIKEYIFNVRNNQIVVACPVDYDAKEVFMSYNKNYKVEISNRAAQGVGYQTAAREVFGKALQYYERHSNTSVFFLYLSTATTIIGLIPLWGTDIFNRMVKMNIVTLVIWLIYFLSIEALALYRCRYS